jgi:hypothetical protein
MAVVRRDLGLLRAFDTWGISLRLSKLITALAIRCKCICSCFAVIVRDCPEVGSAFLVGCTHTPQCRHQLLANTSKAPYEQQRTTVQAPPWPPGAPRCSVPATLCNSWLGGNSSGSGCQGEKNDMWPVCSMGELSFSGVALRPQDAHIGKGPVVLIVIKPIPHHKFIRALHHHSVMS